MQTFTFIKKGTTVTLKYFDNHSTKMVIQKDDVTTMKMLGETLAESYIRMSSKDDWTLIEDVEVVE